MNQHQLNKVIEQTKVDEHNTGDHRHNGDINADILNEMTHKISLKLHKNMAKLDSIMKPSQNQYIDTLSLDEPDHNRMADLMENQLNFSCGVCMEMMESPTKEPILLIPCSHTFCKQV